MIIIARDVRATCLDPDLLPTVRAFLASDPEANLFQLGVLDRSGLNGPGTWMGAIGPRSRLVSVVYLGPRPSGSNRASTAVPTGSPTGCHSIGKAVREVGGTCMIVGPREASDALWEGLGFDPGRISYNQRLYVCDRPPAGPGLDLRPVCSHELAEVTEMGARMLAEDLGLDPRRIRPDIHRERTAARVEEGRILVAEHLGELVFKIDIGDRGTDGVQVGGTYVPERWRGRGFATRGMRELCRRLLAELPRVTLHVNEANEPAVHCYEAAGFRRAAPFRLVSV